MMLLVQRKIVLLLALAVGRGRPAAIHVGNAIQLFADDLLVGSMSGGLYREMHSPQLEPIIRPDTAWETEFAIGVSGTSVVQEQGGKLRLYYSLRNASLGCGHGDQPSCTERAPPQPNFEPSAGPIRTAVAESTDLGSTWYKPLLHRYPLGGSTANNILGPIFRNTTQRNRDGSRPNISVINSVFIDPTAPPETCRRYRGVSGAMPFSSCDGISWWLDEHQFALPHIEGWGIQSFDTQGVAFWDETYGCYSFYTRFTAGCTRTNPATGKPQFVNDQFFRTVRRAQSHSLDTNKPWVNQTIVMRADDQDNQTHSCWGTRPSIPIDYYGATPWFADGMYWMAAVRYWHWGPGKAHAPGGSNYLPGSKDIALATSRDGKNFSFVGERSSWLRPTREGTAGSRSVWLAPPGAVRVGDDDLFFVTRGNTGEGISYAIDPAASAWKSEIAMGRLRKNGLVSLRAKYSRESDAAVLVTRPLIFTGQRLLVNLDAGGGGSLTVEVRRASTVAANGRAMGPAPLTSVPLVVNCVECEVMWEGTPTSAGNATAISAFEGMEVVLSLIMQNCDLYSLQFAQSHSQRTNNLPQKLDDEETAVFSAGQISWGVETMPVSSVGPEAILPAFKFQKWKGPNKAPTSPAWEPWTFIGSTTPDYVKEGRVQDNCPDALFRNGESQDGGALPYVLDTRATLYNRWFWPAEVTADIVRWTTQQNLSSTLVCDLCRYQPQWEIGCEALAADKTESNVKVAVLENDFLRVSVLPIGGKIWSILDKKNGRQLLYNPPVMQLGANEYRPWGAGGMEWNWSPGRIGHVPPLHSASVFMARIKTKKGEVLRIGEFDRWNNTAWQVDLLLDKDRLWVHPHVTNPNAFSIPGYWWTSAAFRSTPKTRVVAPFTMALIEGPCIPFPYGRVGTRLHDNATYRGPDINGCGAKRGGQGLCAWQVDESFMGNNIGHRDYFFQDLNVLDQPARPRITHVDENGSCVLRGMTRTGVLRVCANSSAGEDSGAGCKEVATTRKNNGTKFWPASFNAQMLWQTDFYAGSVAPPGCDQELYDPHCAENLHPGEYVELQNGPAASQIHSFPVPPKSRYEWTEFLGFFNGSLRQLQHEDYAVANREVDSWLSGPNGISAGEEAAMDVFLQSIAQAAPEPEDVLQQASPWAALHATRLGVDQPSPFPGMPLLLNVTRDTKPWIELLQNGTFSAEVLADLAPSSFLVERAWVDLLEKSAADHGWSWLHHLYVGTAVLEMGDASAAQAHFNASLALQPTPHAARALAIFAADAETIASHYQSAWRHWEALTVGKSASIPVHYLELGRELSSEFAAWLATVGRFDELRTFQNQDSVASLQQIRGRPTNDFVFAQIQQLVDSKNHTAALAILTNQSNCFAGLGGVAGMTRSSLITLWADASLGLEQEKLGRAMTATETRRFRRKLNGLGEDGQERGGRFGPPNIGVWFGSF